MSSLRMTKAQGVALMKRQLRMPGAYVRFRVRKGPTRHGRVMRVGTKYVYVREYNLGVAQGDVKIRINDVTRILR